MIGIVDSQEKKSRVGMQKKISELFENTNAEAVLLRNSDVIPEPNFFYFSKLSFGHYSGSFLILKPGRNPVLVATRLEEKSHGHLKTRVFDSEEKLKKALSSELKGTKKIGLNFDLYPKNPFSRLKKNLRGKKFVDISKALSKIRATKTKEETAKIMQAVKISENAIRKVPDFFRKGMTEKQLALKIDNFMRERGDSELAFPTIVASGKSACSPHYITGNKKIGKGLLLIDFGAKYKNYCADLTRMFCIGRAGESRRELYEKVFETKEFVQKLCAPGEECKKIFLQADSFLKKKTGLHLAHAIGHGLGLQVHDFPYGFGGKSKDVLREGMVLTIEPGIYGKFGGLRIEDDVLITKKGAELLSKAPEELVEL